MHRISPYYRWSYWCLESQSLHPGYLAPKSVPFTTLLQLEGEQTDGCLFQGWPWSWQPSSQVQESAWTLLSSSLPKSSIRWVARESVSLRLPRFHPKLMGNKEMRNWHTTFGEFAAHAGSSPSPSFLLPKQQHQWSGSSGAHFNH